MRGLAAGRSENRDFNRSRWKDGITPRLRAAFDLAGLGSEWSGPTLTLVETLDRAAFEALFAEPVIPKNGGTPIPVVAEAAS